MQHRTMYSGQTTVADDDNESGQLLLIAVDQTWQILRFLIEDYNSEY